ncbi:MAG: hypothetical protein ACAI18_19390, partial [Gemmatimonadales bacterium]
MNRPVRPTRRRRLAAALGLSLLALVLYLGTFVVSYEDLFRRDDPLLRSDVARLAPARVEKVDDAREVEQLKAVLEDARVRGLKVS